MASKQFWEELSYELYTKAGKLAWIDPAHKDVVGLQLFDDGFTLVIISGGYGGSPERLTGYFIGEETLISGIGVPWGSGDAENPDIGKIIGEISLNIDEPGEWESENIPDEITWEPGTPEDRKIPYDPERFNAAVKRFRHPVPFVEWVPGEYSVMQKSKKLPAKLMPDSCGVLGEFTLATRESIIPVEERKNYALLIPWELRDNGGADYPRATERAARAGYGAVVITDELPNE